MSLIQIYLASQLELNPFLHDNHRWSCQQHQFWKYWQHEDRAIQLVLSGMGLINMSMAAHSLMQAFKPKACFLVGYSGSHLAEMKVGEVVIAEHIAYFGRHAKNIDGSIQKRDNLIQMGEDFSRLPVLPCDVDLQTEMVNRLGKSGLSYRTGVVGCADQFNSDTVFIQKIHQLYQTLCEDMESAALAQAAFLHQVPCCVIRMISNNEWHAKKNWIEWGGFEKAVEPAFRELSDLVLHGAQTLI